MQIPQDKNWIVRYRWLLIFAVLAFLIGAILVVASAILRTGESSTSTLLMDTVRQATFSKVVSSYGKLKPQRQRTLISRTAGTLIEIRKRPGEGVDENSTVLVLSNPEVVRAVREATLKLQKAKADFKALEADLLDKELTIENDRRILQAEISTKRAELEAQEILAENSIVSELDLRKSRMQLYQLELKLELAQEKEKSAKGATNAKRASGHLAVEQAQYQLEVQKEKLEALNVTAGIEGVLQSQDLNLALGQWIRQGEPLGIVSGEDSLFAELNVNAAEASSIQLGMLVKLSIRGREAMGEVVRVAPNANQNQVQVDVTITEKLPDIARANLDVRGDIIIANEQESRVITRPNSYREGRRLKLYVKQSPNQFELQEIAVLEASEDQLLISENLSLGTEVILNDPSNWDMQPTITTD